MLSVTISFNLNFQKHLAPLWTKYDQECSLPYYGVLEKIQSEHK